MNKASAFILSLSFAFLTLANPSPVLAGDLNVAYSIVHHETLGGGVSGVLQLSVENGAFSGAENVDLRVAPGTVTVGGNGVIQFGAISAGERRSAVTHFMALADFPDEGAPIEVIVDLDMAGAHQTYLVTAQAQ